MEEKEIEEEQEPWWKGPIKWIMAIFLVLMIVLWVFPYYSVRLDPEPKVVPKLEDVIPENIVLENKTYSDYKGAVNPTDPVIKQIASKVSSMACDGNKVCQAKAVYYFVRDRYSYIADPIKKEYIEDPKEFLFVGGGDCESGSIALASLMEAIGINAQLVFVTGHAYARIELPNALKRYKLDEDWVYLDWTCKDCEFGEIPWKNVKKEAVYLEVP